MGYFEKNFPGSPAYFQRIRVSRLVIVYTFVSGGLLYMYAPYFKKLKDGNGWLEKPQLKPIGLTEKKKNPTFFKDWTMTPSKDSIEDSVKVLQKVETGDITGASSVGLPKPK